MIAITLESTVSLGALVIAVLVALSGIAALLYGARWKAAAQVEAANSSAWEDQSRRLQERVDDLALRLGRAEDKIKELEALPDFSSVLAAIGEHEVQAEKRADRVADLLVASNDRQAALLTEIRDAVKAA